jgi:flagellum-specific ATP synthase
MAVYVNSEDLINIGAYVKGSSEEIDDAIAKHPDILDFLIQETDEKYDMDESISLIKGITG